MKYLFLVLFVAMFLPNLGAGGTTQYGSLELSDFIVGPYIVVALVVARRRRGLLVDQVLEVVLLFLAWACIGTIFIDFRYHYASDYYSRFSLLKLAKFAVYCAAGVATARALTNKWIHCRYQWAILAAGVTTATALLLIPAHKGPMKMDEALQAYKANNGISVLISMLVCYLLALWLANASSSMWRFCALPSMGLMVFGGVVTRGRGGWVAGPLRYQPEGRCVHRIPRSVGCSLIPVYRFVPRGHR